MSHPSALPVVMAVALFATGQARAQLGWHGDGIEPVRPKADPAIEKREQEASRPLSSNRILGKILHVDTTANLCVVRLDAPPSAPDRPLVARAPDCTVKAIIVPVPMTGKKTATTGYRVTHGRAVVGLEIVEPGEALLAATKSKLPATAKSASVPVKKPL